MISIGDDPEHTTGTSLLEETVNKKLDPRVFGAAAWAHLSYTQETDDTTASTRDHFSTLVFPNHSYYDGATAQRLQPAATERAIEAASRLSEVPELPENTTLQDRLSNVALQFDAIPAHAETAPYRAHITNVVLDKQIEQKKGGPEKNLTQRSNELFAFYRTVNPNIKTSLLNLQTLTTSLALFNEDSPYGASHLLTKTESGELVPALQLYSREALALFKTDPNDLKADPARALRDFARILVPEMMVNDQLKKATEQDIGLVALMSKVGGESTQQRLLSTFLGLMAMEDMTRMLVGVPVMMSVVAATRPRETTLDTPAKMEQQEFITAGTGQAVSPTGKISQYQTTLGVFNDSEGNVVCSFRSDNDQANIDRAQKAAESMGKSLNEVLRYFYTIQEIISGNPLLAKALLG